MNERIVRKGDNLLVSLNAFCGWGIRKTGDGSSYVVPQYGPCTKKISKVIEDKFTDPIFAKVEYLGGELFREMSTGKIALFVGGRFTSYDPAIDHNCFCSLETFSLKMDSEVPLEYSSYCHDNKYIRDLHKEDYIARIDMIAEKCSQFPLTIAFNWNVATRFDDGSIAVYDDLVSTYMEKAHTTSIADSQNVLESLNSAKNKTNSLTDDQIAQIEEEQTSSGMHR